METSKTIAGAYTNRPGVHDKLIKNGDETYRITKKDRTALNFDTNGNMISLTLEPVPKSIVEKEEHFLEPRQGARTTS